MRRRKCRPRALFLLPVYSIGFCPAFCRVNPCAMCKHFKLREPMVEKEKKKKSYGKLILMIAGLLFSVSLYCLSLLNFGVLPEKINIVINVISVAIFYIIFSLSLFNIMFSPDNIQKSFYITFQIVVSSLPLGLFGQYLKFNSLLICIITLIITLIIYLNIYKKLKKLEIKHIKYLKFKNLLITTSYTILFPILGLIRDICDKKILRNMQDITNLNIIDIFNLLNSKVEILLFLTCVSPLLFLQIIYEKLLLEDDLRKNDT